MKKIISSLLVAIFATQFVFAMEEIAIEGSTTVLPVAQATAEIFMDNNADADISVRGGGSGVGIAALIDGRCDVADASRAIKDKELDKAIENGIEPKAHVVAMDGIAVIINKANPIKNFTKADLKAIYTGKVSFWNEIDENAPDKAIVVVSRDSASGTYEAFNKLALSKAKVRSDALLSASNKAVIKTVETTKGAIGYIGLGYLNSTVKLTTVEDIKCSKATVLSGKYPLSRPLFMYTNGEPTGLTKEYMDFVLSKKGQQIVEESGYIGLQ